MPILAREADLYPKDLLDRDDLDREPDSGWWALYTLSRREKDLMRRLRSRGRSFYGPTIPRRTKTPSGRVFTSHLPLFPNYVFIYGNEDHRYEAVALGCVSRCIWIVDVAALVRDLRRIHQLIRCGVPLTPESRLRPGRLVRVSAGPFRGYEGVILCRNGQTRLVVAVDFLQQGASLVIDECDVEDLG